MHDLFTVMMVVECSVGTWDTEFLLRKAGTRVSGSPALCWDPLEIKCWPQILFHGVTVGSDPRWATVQRDDLGPFSSSVVPGPAASTSPELVRNAVSGATPDLLNRNTLGQDKVTGYLLCALGCESTDPARGAEPVSSL